MSGSRAVGKEYNPASLDVTKKKKAPTGEPVVYTFMAGNKKPVRQKVPFSWVEQKKTVRDLFKNVVVPLGFTLRDLNSLAIVPSDAEPLTPGVDVDLPIGEALLDGGVYTVKMTGPPSLGLKEGAPTVRSRLIFGELTQRVRAEGPTDTAAFTAKVTTPSGMKEATILPLEGGGCEVRYRPVQPGTHVIEVLMNGVAISDKAPIAVAEVSPTPYGWHELDDSERAAMLGWIRRRLAAAGLNGVAAVASAAASCDVVADEAAAAASGTSEHTLRLLGLVPEHTEVHDLWNTLRDAIMEAVPTAQCNVTARDRKELAEVANRLKEASDTPCDLMQHNYTRAVDVATMRVAPPAPAAAAVPPARPSDAALSRMAAVIGATADDAASVVGEADDAGGRGVGKSSPFKLSLVAFTEHWVTAQMPHPQLVAGLQLEGYADARTRDALAAAAAGAARDVSGVSEAAVHLDSVVWFRGVSQGRLHAHRRATRAYGARAMQRLDATGTPLSERQRAAVTVETEWLAHAETLCGTSKGIGGLPSLLGADDPALAPGAAALPPPPPSREVIEEHEWARGKKRISDAPPIDVYPNFLSEAEVEHLLRLGLCHASPTLVSEAAAKAEAADRTGASAPLPRTSTDDLLAAIEERCSRATRVPLHEDEPPLTMRFEAAAAKGQPLVEEVGIGLPNAQRCFRAASVHVFLNDVGYGDKGEMRFPLADAPEGWPEVRSAHKVLTNNTTLRGDDDKMPKEWLLVHTAAAMEPYGSERARGVRVAPKRGTAVVFWSMEQDCKVDPRTWHAQARVKEGCGGKVVLEKVKWLPKFQRAIVGATAWDRGWIVGPGGGKKFVEKERTIDDIWADVEKETGPVRPPNKDPPKDTRDPLKDEPAKDEQETGQAVPVS